MFEQLLYPAAILSVDGYFGDVTAIQEDPTTPDANWLTVKWFPPYPLPGVGQTLYVQGQNSIESARPALFNPTNWRGTLFESYGTGIMLPEWSPGGAYGQFVTGGHGHATMMGGCVFDFTDAQWKYIPNANGVPEFDNTGVARSVADNESTGYPYWEMPGTQVPAPPHTYANAVAIPASVLGNTKGGYAYVGRAAVCVGANTTVASHVYNLDTNQWSRLTSNLPVGLAMSSDATALLDPVTNRVYVITDGYHNYQFQHYLDLSTGAWGTIGPFEWPDELPGRSMGHIDPDKRILIVYGGNDLRVLNLNDPGSGWLAVAKSGTPPNIGISHWCRHDGNGKWYWLPKAGGSTLYRMTIPADPFSGTWVFDTIALSGPAPQLQNGAGDMMHYRALTYVPSLNMLAWVVGTATAIANSQQVLLINPE